MDHRRHFLVRPDKPVVSYLTPLTGMTQEHLDAQGTDFASAVQTLRSQLPPSSVLVGQNILKDVEWLGLVRGTDFADMVDLSALLRCWNSRFNSYSYFSQDHYAGVWLGNARTEADAHDAVAAAGGEQLVLRVEAHGEDLGVVVLIDHFARRLPLHLSLIHI